MPATLVPSTGQFEYIYINKHIYIYIYLYIYVYVCIRIYIYTYICIHVYMYMITYIYIYMYMYAHTNRLLQHKMVSNPEIPCTHNDPRSLAYPKSWGIRKVRQYQCVALCCSVLQGVAWCGIVLQFAEIISVQGELL